MSDITPQDALAALEAWIAEEGIETGARSVVHVEYDSNWRGAFRVELREWIGQGNHFYIGHGPNRIGGLGEAILDAINRARSRSSSTPETHGDSAKPKDGERLS